MLNEALHNATRQLVLHEKMTMSGLWFQCIFNISSHSCEVSHPVEACTDPINQLNTQVRHQVLNKNYLILSLSTLFVLAFIILFCFYLSYLLYLSDLTFVHLCLFYLIYSAYLALSVYLSMFCLMFCFILSYLFCFSSFFLALIWFFVVQFLFYSIFISLKTYTSELLTQVIKRIFKRRLNL
jgi:hypothetical protein